MIDFNYAMQKAEEIKSPEAVISEIRRISFGWIFVFVSKLYLQTGNDYDMDIGSPGIFVSVTGQVEVMPSHISIDMFIQSKIS